MKKDILKKIIACVCIMGLALAVAGCKKDNENSVQAPTSQTENSDVTEQVGIENGGDFDEEGNVIEGSDAPFEVAKPEDGGDIEEDTGFFVPETSVELKYGEDGNITKECAVELLQKYTAEQLGLTPNASHQLLFDSNNAEVEGKKCYAIAAKIPDKETEGVFYVAFDGSAVYKYDITNQIYIKMP